MTDSSGKPKPKTNAQASDSSKPKAVPSKTALQNSGTSLPSSRPAQKPQNVEPSAASWQQSEQHKQGNQQNLSTGKVVQPDTSRSHDVVVSPTRQTPNTQQSSNSAPKLLSSSPGRDRPKSELSLFVQDQPKSALSITVQNNKLAEEDGRSKIKTNPQTSGHPGPTASRPPPTPGAALPQQLQPSHPPHTLPGHTKQTTETSPQPGKNAHPGTSLPQQVQPSNSPHVQPERTKQTIEPPNQLGKNTHPGTSLPQHVQPSNSHLVQPEPTKQTIEPPNQLGKNTHPGTSLPQHVQPSNSHRIQPEPTKQTIEPPHQQGKNTHPQQAQLSSPPHTPPGRTMQTTEPPNQQGKNTHPQQAQLSSPPHTPPGRTIQTTEPPHQLGKNIYPDSKSRDSYNAHVHRIRSTTSSTSSGGSRNKSKKKKKKKKKKRNSQVVHKHRPSSPVNPHEGKKMSTGKNQKRKEKSGKPRASSGKSVSNKTKATTASAATTDARKVTEAVPSRTSVTFRFLDRAHEESASQTSSPTAPELDSKLSPPSLPVVRLEDPVEHKQPDVTNKRADSVKPLRPILRVSHVEDGLSSKNKRNQSASLVFVKMAKYNASSTSVIRLRPVCSTKVISYVVAGVIILVVVGTLIGLIHSMLG